MHVRGVQGGPARDAEEAAEVSASWPRCPGMVVVRRAGYCRLVTMEKQSSESFRTDARWGKRRQRASGVLVCDDTFTAGVRDLHGAPGTPGKISKDMGCPARASPSANHGYRDGWNHDLQPKFQ